MIPLSKHASYDSANNLKLQIIIQIICHILYNISNMLYNVIILHCYFLHNLVWYTRCRILQSIDVYSISVYDYINLWSDQIILETWAHFFLIFTTVTRCHPIITINDRILTSIFQTASCYALSAWLRCSLEWKMKHTGNICQNCIFQVGSPKVQR